jgi:hypothetical protein
MKARKNRIFVEIITTLCRFRNLTAGTPCIDVRAKKHFGATNNVDKDDLI